MDDSIQSLARQIAFDVTGAQPLQVIPIVGLGSVNAVFRVETPNDRCIIRLNPDRRISVFEKERWCMEQALNLGLPTSTVIAVGALPEAAFMVQTFVEGQNGRDYAGKTDFIWERLGNYSRLIHNVAVRGFGEDLADAATGRFKDSWQRFVAYNISSLVPGDALIRLGVVTPRTSLVLRSRFERLLETPFAFGLNHGDLALRNTLIAPDGTVVLLDWGCAEAHIVPHFELIELMRLGVAEYSPDFAAFLYGYGLSAAEYREMLPDLRMLRALRAVDKLRWAIDRSPADIPEFAIRARQAIDAD